MFKYKKAYLVPNKGVVVTEKSAVPEVEESEFVEVKIVLKMSEIKEWADEIEMLGLDEDEEF